MRIINQSLQRKKIAKADYVISIKEGEEVLIN